jgi:hypothetical protein
MLYPAILEALVDCLPDRFEDDDLSSNEAIVKPSDNFRAEYPLLMGSCLVDLNKTPTIKVRVKCQSSKMPS